MESALGIAVLRHKDKKPAGGPEDLESHFGCSVSELVMVGDRYLTDVVFGNRLGMLTVRVVRCTIFVCIHVVCTAWYVWSFVLVLTDGAFRCRLRDVAFGYRLGAFSVWTCRHGLWRGIGSCILWAHLRASCLVIFMPTSDEPDAR